jgi:predicted ATPase
MNGFSKAYSMTGWRLGYIHAPSHIIVSYPDALIYEVDGESLQEVTYEQTKQYQLMRYFLNNYKSMLRDIIGKSE